jgi:hypothetical protein
MTAADLARWPATASGALTNRTRYDVLFRLEQLARRIGKMSVRAQWKELQFEYKGASALVTLRSLQLDGRETHTMWFEIAIRIGEREAATQRNPASISILDLLETTPDESPPPASEDGATDADAMETVRGFIGSVIADARAYPARIRKAARAIESGRAKGHSRITIAVTVITILLIGCGIVWYLIAQRTNLAAGRLADGSIVYAEQVNGRTQIGIIPPGSSSAYVVDMEDFAVGHPHLAGGTAPGIFVMQTTPWIAEVAIAPSQTEEVVRELQQDPSNLVRLSYTPAAPPLLAKRVATYDKVGSMEHVQALSDIREFPHQASAYVLSAIVRNPRDGSQEEFKATLRFDPSGRASLR